jgi:hypothetical protein
MASSHFYEGYRSNVSANRSGERSNFTGANVAAKKLSNSSSTVDAKHRCVVAPPFCDDTFLTSRRWFPFTEGKVFRLRARRVRLTTTSSM